MAPQRPRNTKSSKPAIPETTIGEVLSEALKTDFNHEKSAELFEARHRTRLSKGGPDNLKSDDDEVLHVIAQKSGLGDYKSLLTWVVKNRTQLFNCGTRGRGGETPLHLAIMRKNHEFVQFILENVDPAVFLEQSTESGLTCLHYAIKETSPFTHFMITKALELPSKATMQKTIEILEGNKLYPKTGPRLTQSDVFMAQPKAGEYEGKTPLHLAVWVVDDEPDTTSGDNSAKTVNVKHDRSVEEEEATTTSEKKVANVKTRMAPDGSKAAHEIREPKNDINRFSKAKAFHRKDIVKQLINAADRVLVECVDIYYDTPFQTRLYHLDDLLGEPVNTKPRTLAEIEVDELRWHKTIEGDDILLDMRKYIIEVFSRREAMIALYKPGDERVLEFDLTGLPYSTINTDFLRGLGKVLRFEGLLKYVALPPLTVEDDDSSEFTEQNTEDFEGQVDQYGANTNQNDANKAKGKGIQNMVPIFRWLKNRNVRSVLTVTVVDNVEPSHSDEAIESCMKDLDIHIWNWYKIDLCCDVILNSAKSAKNVTLYSSGNNAVLVGWSSPVGLANLKELKSVHIYVQEGLERPGRLKQYMNTFETSLKSSLQLKYKNDVRFTWDPIKANPNPNSVFTNRGVEKAGSESKWMKTMIDFAEMLKMAKNERSNEAQPIKIAIIDDGINMALSSFADTVKGGESFYRLSELSGRRGAYYAPTGPHGTLMAELICDICPVAHLYIAQLELLPGQNGQRSFSAESATEAINWAIRKEVDIISMSWSINTSRNLSRLNKALREATKQNIIMFCASIDEGATTFDDTYPGKWQSCIKIGATTGTGAKLSWVSESQSHFLLPGEVPQSSSEPNLWNNPHIGSFGSSVSTALAAGLAGVLLYCDRLIGSDLVESEDIDEESPLNARPPDIRWVDYFRNMSNMATAFNKLSKGTEYNKFPQVWEYFETDHKWNWDACPDDTEKAKNWLQGFIGGLKSSR